MIELGNFELHSGNVMVSDPCYEEGSWGQAQLNNTKIGEWIANIKQFDEGEWGIRNGELIAFHKSIEKLNELDWKLEKTIIGVDSGQAGIFDLAVFRNDEVSMPSNFLSSEIQEEKGEKWYSHICDLTLETKERAGITIGGVVSSSGYGDGGYKLFTIRDENDSVVAIKIVFIDNDIEEE
ncbi:DUF4241 domain-containing protein [Heyndrickxia camelliae]|uniref:DUF4241 domain-containing protein n=1 Tax=Heyndrickxia camelliae TaxID=1707093 RepID=A0A2N3LCT0_9BACI|nr:DUF4241 domain-containing protein [Heyndrickxia camelliae]PKR82409.1 hypothetical protein CWO92_24645 [Heyndrickxia camelliae]